jgi:hypothetical protein
MSKRKPVKEKTSSVVFKTGDGKNVKVDNGICKMSEHLIEIFSEESEVYFENATERSIELLVEFYNEYLGLSSKQIDMLGDPKQYLTGKKPDPELITLHESYKKLPYQNLFGLLKVAYDMKIKSLSGMLTHIVADIIANKGIDELEEEFSMVK